MLLRTMRIEAMLSIIRIFKVSTNIKFKDSEIQQLV